MNGDGIAAGWYSDPSDATMIRYWDGVVWTERVAPLSTEAMPPRVTENDVATRVQGGVDADLRSKAQAIVAHVRDAMSKHPPAARFYVEWQEERRTRSGLMIRRVSHDRSVLVTPIASFDISVGAWGADDVARKFYFLTEDERVLSAPMPSLGVTVIDFKGRHAGFRTPVWWTLEEAALKLARLRNFELLI